MRAGRQASEGPVADALLQDVLADLRAILRDMDAALSALARSPADQALRNAIFRSVHGIKGLCGFLALPRLSAVAQATEALLARWREGAEPVTPAGLTLLTAACAAMHRIVLALETSGIEPSADEAGLIAALVGVPGAAPPPAASPPALQSALRREQRRGRGSRASRPADAAPGATSHRALQPVGRAWAGLPRLVATLGAELGKRLELATEGADIALDRRMIAPLRNALIHLVRNSADHGLERPEQRRRLGKPETGRITLSARRTEAGVMLEVSDDGSGFDLDRICRKARSLGLAGDAVLTAMPDSELLRLVLQPGFSTAETVTTVSGRGVGLDIVATNLRRCGGTVDLRSTPGRGTVIRLSLPAAPAMRAGPSVARLAPGQVPGVLRRAPAQSRPSAKPARAAPATPLRDPAERPGGADGARQNSPEQGW
jgi:two-component system chemotaxis sensor kinase CheA